MRALLSWLARWLRPSENAQVAALAALDKYGESSALAIWDAIMLDGRLLASARREAVAGTLKRRHIYSVMHWLENEGLVTSRETEPLKSRSDRPRVLYTLTDEGRARLAARTP